MGGRVTSMSVLLAVERIGATVRAGCRLITGSNRLAS
jgi:hypothetical protein